jgi:hypothetical protein
MDRVVLVEEMGVACAGNDPGAGTKTLSVDGRAIASPRVANAKLATDFATEFSVRISLAGTDVTTAA